MDHPLDILPLPNGAAFIFTPCPGTKQASLVSSIEQIKHLDAAAVVTLLPNHELELLAVSDLGKHVQQQGMNWFQFPIEDDCAPQDDFFNAFLPAKRDLLDLIQQRAKIVIHCRGGTGRTGLVAAILLLEIGEPWPSVERLIRSVRPESLKLVPHLDFLRKHYSI